MYRVLVKNCVTLTTQGQGKLMYFLVNVSPPKPLDVATSNFAAK